MTKQFYVSRHSTDLRPAPGVRILRTLGEAQAALLVLREEVPREIIVDGTETLATVRFFVQGLRLSPRTAQVRVIYRGCEVR